MLYLLRRQTGDHKDLEKLADATRGEEGCLEAECYRSLEFSENLAVVELWADEISYTAHWNRLLEGDSARESILRSEGADTSAEFYRHQGYASQALGPWTPPEWEGVRPAITWPAGGRVRIIGQTSRANVESSLPDLKAFSGETRREPGCIEFEQFQSVEYTEDTMTLELWTDQVVYDFHWSLRGQSRRAGSVLASSGTAERTDRIQGTNGFEFYQCAMFKHLYDRWRPVDVSQWSEQVIWRI